MKTPILVPCGIYAGHLIRRAVKPGPCRCGSTISAGDLYLEGVWIDAAGAFAHERICAACFPPEAALAAGADEADE